MHHPRCINKQGNNTTKMRALWSDEGVGEKSSSTCTEATNANSALESLALNKRNYRSKKKMDRKISMKFVHHHGAKQFEITKMNCTSARHPTFGVIQDKTPRSVKHETRE